MKLHLYNDNHIGKAPEPKVDPEPTTSKAAETDGSHEKANEAIENATPPTSSDEPAEASTSNAGKTKKLIPKEPTPGWGDFTKEVKDGYTRYKNGDANNGNRRWDPQYRGVNNSGAGHKQIPQNIRDHIAGQAKNNGGQVNLGSKGNPDYYTLSNSFSAGVSLKKLPKDKDPYIYHY